MEDIYTNRRIAVPLNEQGMSDYWNDKENPDTIAIFDFPPIEVKAFYEKVEEKINDSFGTMIDCCEPGTIENANLQSCLDIVLKFESELPVFCKALKLAVQCNTCVEIEI